MGKAASAPKTGGWGTLRKTYCPELEKKLTGTFAELETAQRACQCVALSPRACRERQSSARKHYSVLTLCDLLRNSQSPLLLLSLQHQASFRLEQEA